MGVYAWLSIQNTNQQVCYCKGLEIDAYDSVTLWCYMLTSLLLCRQILTKTSLLSHLIILFLRERDPVWLACSRYGIDSTALNNFCSCMISENYLELAHACKSPSKKKYCIISPFPHPPICDVQRTYINICRAYVNWPELDDILLAEYNWHSSGEIIELCILWEQINFQAGLRIKFFNYLLFCLH